MARRLSDAEKAARALESVPALTLMRFAGMRLLTATLAGEDNTETTEEAIDHLVEWLCEDLNHTAAAWRAPLVDAAGYGPRYRAALDARVEREAASAGTLPPPRATAPIDISDAIRRAFGLDDNGGA